MLSSYSRIVSFFTLLICSYRLQAQQQGPSILWQKCLGGSRNDNAYSIVRATDGGYLVAGASNSNDGDISGHHGSIDSTDAWIVKLDADGHLLWQKSLGGSGKDEIDHIVKTSDGGYIGIGSTTSLDGDVVGCHGNAWRDIWVVKLDRYGALQWQKCLGGTFDEVGNSIRQTSDSGYIIGGSAGSHDGDVSGNAAPNYSFSAWVVKLDKIGSIQWNHTYNNSGSASAAYDIMPLSSGEYVIASESDMDGGDYGSAGHANPPNSYALKVDAAGNVIKVIYTGQRSSAYGFLKMNEAQFFLLTDLENCYPNNPNFGFSVRNYDTTLTALGSNDNFAYCPNASIYGYRAKNTGSMLLKSDGTGVVAGTTSDTTGLGNHGGYTDALLSSFYPHTWGKCYGGSAMDFFQEIVAEDDFTYIVAGYTNSNDGDVSGNHGGNDFWVVKLSKINVIKGTVFLDYNLNGTRDGAEPLVDNVLVQSSLGGASSGSRTFNGLFYNIVDTGVYATQVVSPLSFYAPSPATASSTFHTYNNTDSLSFALQPIPGKRDYSVGLFSPDFPRAGFDATFYVNYTNKGTDTMVNKRVMLIKDPHYSFISAVPAQSSISGDTITWIISGVNPRQSGTILVHMNLSAPPVTKLGDSLLTIAVIDSLNDLFAADNITYFHTTTISSYDPNDKAEVHGGIVTKDDLNKGNSLLYTIRFQNTGNDTAFTVVVRDTLDNSKVDPSTVEMVGSSHPYELNIHNGNQLTWTFSSILLPDSTKNGPASQGYLAYRVKLRQTIAEGDTILNAAGIYFDYNLPVATPTQQTVVTKLVVAVPPAPVISGLKASYCHDPGTSVKITNIPSAVYQATVIAKVDNAVVQVAADSSIALGVGVLSAGSHVLSVIFKNAAGADTTSQSFSVDVQAAPLVDLNSNITTVTSLTQPVVLTATNLSGGGNQPLYTFAKDRAFSALLQGESPLISVTVDPTTLLVGDNYFFVRMKTSDSCYNVQTDVDSVNVMRSAVTGLVDIDYPGQVINITPNPFTSYIFINGLQSSKSYSISLLNSNGQTLIRKKVTGQQQATVNTGGLPGGIFLLRVYDEKKKRLIGSAKLLSSAAR